MQKLQGQRMLLVTGITGHSGKYFLQQLIDYKYSERIRCIVRESSDTSLLDRSEIIIEKVIGDLGDQEFMNDAMIDIDTVMHIGSIFYSKTVMLAAVKSNTVKRIILVHTTGIYSKYKSASEEYKRIELEIEKIIKSTNRFVSLIYLRPTMIYGNINDRNMAIFIKMVDKLRFFPVIDHGKNLLQPVNARDLGKAYFQVLSRPNIMNGDYVLSGEKPISMLEIFTLISKQLNKKTIFINVPLALGVLLASFFKLCTFGKVDYVERVQRMGENRSYSHEDAARDFEYRPMPFADGLKIEVSQYLSHRDSHG